MATARTPKGTPKSRANKSFEETDQELATVLAQAPESEMDSLMKADRAARATTALKGVNLTDVASGLAVAAISIKSQLDSINAQVASHVELLESLKAAKEVMEAEIAELYGKEVLAQSLMQLRDRFTETTTATLQKTKEAEDRYQQSMKDMAVSFEDTRKEQRRVWDQEKRDYEFAKKEQRRLEDDNIAQTRLQEGREHEARFAVLKSEIDRRTNILTEKEVAYNDALKRIEGLPAEIKAEVARAEAVLKAVLTKDFDHKTEIATMAAKAEKDMLVSQVRGLQQQLEAERIANAATTARLVSSEARVESIAKEALLSASGRSALEAASNMAATLKDTPKK